MIFDDRSSVGSAESQPLLCYPGIVADITEAILHQLLISFFQWVALFAKRFHGLIGRTGNPIERLICGISYFVYVLSMVSMIVSSLIEPQVSCSVGFIMFDDRSKDG